MHEIDAARRGWCTGPAGTDAGVARACGLSMQKDGLLPAGHAPAIARSWRHASAKGGKLSSATFSIPDQCTPCVVRIRHQQYLQEITAGCTLVPRRLSCASPSVAMPDHPAPGQIVRDKVAGMVDIYNQTLGKEDAEKEASAPSITKVSLRL